MTHKPMIMAVITVFLLCLGGTAQADDASATPAPNFVPFDGKSGYLDIPIAPDTWYVAFLSTGKTTIDIVTTAWRARSAQLCMTVGANKFVELNYLGEIVRNQDKVSALDADFQAWMMPTGSHPAPTTIYIPGNSPKSGITTTGKMASIKCLQSDQGLIDAKRLVDGVAALQTAQSAGIVIK